MLALSHEVQRPFDKLRNEIQAAIGRWLPGRRKHDSGGTADGLPLVRWAFGGPALDVEQTDDAVIVRAELPGLRPEEVRVDATGNRLTIRGEKGEEHEERGRGFHRMARRYGSFVRSIALPCDVDPDRATARFRDGVLTAALPKTEASRTRRVPVDVHRH